MYDLKNWRRFSGTFSFSHDEPIDVVTIEVACEDAIISIEEDPTTPLPMYVTDLQFQASGQLTGWVPETREFTKKILHTNDEFAKRSSPDDVYLGGRTPVKYTNKEFREYNIAGRGLEVFTLPNWHPEDWTIDILPTGLDIEITPKDDYDFMRVCTNAGSLKAPEDYYNGDPEHPLSMSYTREFSLGKGSAGVPIKILSRSGKASRGGSKISVGKERTVSIGNGESLEIRRRSFFLAQKGAVRIRIEFYKSVSQGFDKNGIESFLLEDTGIGYQGTAKFNQWTYGRSRF